MKRPAQLLTFLLVLIAGFFVYQYFVPAIRAPQGFLKIEANPEAMVGLGGQSLGATPLQEKNLKVGSYDLTLTAQVPTFSNSRQASASARTVSFNQKIDLYPSAVTVVRYNFAPDALFASGETLALRKGAGISITTNPEGTGVFIDGEGVGAAPLSSVVSPGVHTLKVSKEGYVTREIGINIQDGFRLTASVSLAISPYPQNKKLESKGKYSLFDLSAGNLNLTSDFSAWAQAIWYFQTSGQDVPRKFDLLIDANGKTYTLDPTYSKKKAVTVGYLSDSAGKLSTKAKAAWGKLLGGKAAAPKVKILATPNGFLNVRSGPGTSFPIVKKVKPGDTFEVLAEKSGWYKISISSKSSGWIAAGFAKKI